MKVLVSANVPGVTEFCYVPEGEVLYRGPFVCASNCGCERSLSGTDTALATSTAKVAELDVDVEALVEKVAKRSGWPSDIVSPGIREAINAAGHFEVGAVIHAHHDFDTEEWVYSEVEVPGD